MNNKNILDLLLTNSLNEKEYFFITDYDNGLKDDEVNDWLLRQYLFKIQSEISNISDKKDRLNFINNLITNKVDKFTTKKIYSEFESDEYDVTTLKLGITELFTEPISSRLFKEFSTMPSEFDLISPFISSIMLNQLLNHVKNDNNLFIRIITTTYDGISNLESIKKIKWLVQNYPNNFIAVLEDSFSNNTERLHAKSYDFKRQNGFGSLYIGSSNFTKTGTLTGKEYNVKISEFADKRIYDQQQREFNTLFNQNNFINFKTDMDKINEIINIMTFKTNELKRMKVEESKKLIHLKQKEESKKSYIPFEYQSKAIKQIKNETINGKHKHLLVMATGTGKTATVAFYVNEIRGSDFDTPKVLFIAPRKEILEQAKNTFKNILDIEDDEFAELYNSKINIHNFDSSNYSIFLATPNTLKGDFLKKISKEKFDCVIFDEAHHMEANSIQKIFDSIESNSDEIIGITATPQRMDGVDVSKYFGDSYTYELRLFEAIEKNLLSKFNYYFIEDDSTETIDFDITDEKRLTNFLSTDKRNDFVYKSIIEYIGVQNVTTRTLIFCASIEHAKNVSDYLRSKNERSEYIASQIYSEKDEQWIGLKTIDRDKIRTQFENAEINYLCTVDMFNEGVDIPSIDNVIFLRPTSSSIVYIQQLGRGLRKLPDKKLEVFDFVNNVNTEKNKYYDPLGFVRLINPNISLKETINNINSINNYLPDGVNFNFTKISAKRIVKYLKQLESSGNSFSFKTFANYKKNKISSTYEKLRNYLNETKVSTHNLYSNECFSDATNLERNGFLKISLINVEWIIKEMFECFIDKKTTNNVYIHRLINDAFAIEGEKGVWTTLFEGGLYKEICALLRYKLNFERLLPNEVNDLKGLKMSFMTAQNLFLTNPEINLLTNSQSSVNNYASEKLIIIRTSESDSDTTHGYENSYNYETKVLKWAADPNWKLNPTPGQKTFLDESTTVKLLYRSYEDTKLYKNTPGGKIHTYIGEVEKINGVREYWNIKKNKNNIFYLMKLK
ncbi:DEAD/DEAH box helicase family protein [Spiroplasma endosymbiont of Othius punctulatus]|uniref:DEAD/DEAH box helicase family protein n=1 Tax=Spiroplasma endosymbiont of Othius punctulatus TaxID=3066289 RepID=UPI0030D5849A